LGGKAGMKLAHYRIEGARFWNLPATEVFERETE
jgi:hypothetical protein